MFFVTLRYTDESTLFLSRIGQAHNSLVTPQKILHWRLVDMQESIILSGLVVPFAVHEAKAIKRRF